MRSSETKRPARRVWERLQLWLGVGPLLAYACFHLWQLWPALAGRELWVDRARSSQLSTTVLVLLALAAGMHAALGVLRFSAPRRAGSEVVQPSIQLRGFQLFTGVLLMGFVVYHVWQLWPDLSREPGPHATVRSAYDTLWTTLGLPLPLTIYVVGTTALAFHVGTALARLCDRLRPGAPPAALRYLAGLCGLLLWLGYLQLVARFAIGEGLIPTARPLPTATSQPSRSP